MMDLLQQVKETEHDGFCFEVKHKILEIPRAIYLDNVQHYHDPYSEAAAQHFTESYLDWKNDIGVVGMIRINNDHLNENVILEAAVRYIVICD
ncbi:MAG: hypothetical protein SCK28_07645 [Bacillota bacterium]|nr:hypothetical protein [Bacillota bacterium]